MRARIKALALAAAMFGIGSTAGAAEPVKIRLSYIVPVANWATMLFQTPGLAKHLGKSYTFEAIHFQGTPQLIQALAAGEIEIANVGFTTLPLAIINAGMQDIRIISDELQDGVPGYFSDEFVVRKDDTIHKVEDLKGRVLGVNAFGSGTDIPLRAMLAKHGLQDKRDVTIVEGPIPALPAMLLEKKIDLFPFVLPFSADPKVHAQVRVLFTQGDAMGITQLGMWAARAPFIAQHHAALVDFMEDALRQERWYYDPANHKQAVAIAAKVTKAPEAQFDRWLFVKKGQDGDYYRDPNGRPALEAIQASIEEQVKLGSLKQNIDIKKYADLSLVEEAVKRLQ
ncbi:MAG TPA: ABC transporter substrate-binding protein [Stellaceae bacterium]|nr:ABC transporter substrate-binding protein [Stellaceae bacterium]